MSILFGDEIYTESASLFNAAIVCWTIFIVPI